MCKREDLNSNTPHTHTHTKKLGVHACNPTAVEVKEDDCWGLPATSLGDPVSGSRMSHDSDALWHLEYAHRLMNHMLSHTKKQSFMNNHHKHQGGLYILSPGRTRYPPLLKCCYQTTLPRTPYPQWS